MTLKPEVCSFILSMEEIASRARAGKGALYRRRRSKAEPVVAACNVRRGEIPAGRDPEPAGDAIIAFDVFRWLLLGEVPDRDWVHRVLLDLIYPAVTAPLE